MSKMPMSLCHLKKRTIYTVAFASYLLIEKWLDLVESFSTRIDLRTVVNVNEI